MIEVNLLPAEYRKKEGPKMTLPAIPIGKPLFIVIGAFFAVQVLAAAFAAYQIYDLRKIRERVSALSAITREIGVQKKEIEFVHGRLKLIDETTARPFYWSMLLNALSDSVIKGVWLRSFSVIEKMVKVKEEEGPVEKGAKRKRAPKPKNLKILELHGSAIGQGDETASVGKFIKEMKDNLYLSELFDSIELVDIVQTKIQNYDVYDFVINCTFKKNKAVGA